MTLLAGVRSDSTTNWTKERSIRIFSNCLFVFGISMLALDVLSDFLERWDDNFVKVMALLKLTSICLSCLKTVAIVFLKEPIATLRTFILSQRVNSGDEVFDALERRKLNETARTMLRCMLGLIVVEMILLSIPNQTMDNVFRMPPVLLHIGETPSRIVHALFMCSLPVFLLPRLFSNIAYIGVLIMGMQMKLKMLAHRYRGMLNLTASNVENYLERVDTLEPSFSCGKIWDSTDFPPFFLLTFLSLLLEYYVWCHLVDSFHDVASSMGEEIYEICVHIPHSRDHHSKYIQLRTSLIIIWINNSNGYTVNCFGLLNLSILTFVDMANITYSLLMFLINVG
nr:uncharacterized protein LOC109417563 [Aedes albopictus]